MNIHFKDENLFKKLKHASLVKVEVGSKMYGTSDEESDTDYLYIYCTSNSELNSFNRSHHQLQFKNDEGDHNFVSLHTFLSNAINGDSTINYEVIQSGCLHGSNLEFLYSMRNSFNNYSIVRSYLGLARRDSRHYFKDKTHRGQIKKLGHIWRGYIFAKSIMEGNFLVTHGDFISEISELKKIEETNYSLKKDYLEKYTNLISDLRNNLNEKMQDKTLLLSRLMDIDSQKMLDKNIHELMKDASWEAKSSLISDLDMTYFYDAYENWVNYE